MSLRDLFARAKSVLASIAPITPIKSDDALVVLIDAALADAELLGFFRQAENDHDDGKLSLTATPPVALQATVESLSAKGIDWAKLIEMLPAVIALIKSLRG